MQDSIVAILIYWLVILFSLMVAFSSLGLVHGTEFMERILLFVPNLILAIVIFTLGAYFAGFIDATVTNHCKTVKLQDAAYLGFLARCIVIALVILLVLDQLDIGAIVHHSFL